jgi:gas vesicle protein
MPTDPVYNPSLPFTPDAGIDDEAPSPWPESSYSTAYRSSDSAWLAMAAGLAVGACLGAAVALLYTPMRGSAIRNSLRNYAGQGRERLSHLLEDGRSLAGDALQRAASLIEEGRRAFRTTGSTRKSEPSSQPLTASVAEIAGYDRRFEEPLGG